MPIASAQQIVAAVDAIRARCDLNPRVGIILGTGLGRFVEQLEVEEVLDYASIPGFPPATALGHCGQFVCGTVAGLGVVAMNGRVHLYEGYSADEVTFGVRVMAALGIERLIISNACGGLNPNFAPGDVMVIEDHINFTFANPLVGPHDSACGLGYPDLSCPYDRQLIARAREIGRRAGFAVHAGVYVGVVGPNYETRAEYRFFRRMGGDAVGMSTVPEVIVAAQCGLRVLALSVVTNVCLPDQIKSTTAQEVIAVAESAEPKLREIVLGVLAEAAVDARK